MSSAKPFSTILFLSLFIYLYTTSSQNMQVSATHRDNIDIPLIDISIPNVNTGTPSACMRTHTGDVAVEGKLCACILEESLRAS